MRYEPAAMLIYIWDMSRRQYIRKITKYEGYEPAADFIYKYLII